MNRWQAVRLAELAKLIGDLDADNDAIFNAALRVLDAFDVAVPEEVDDAGS